MLAHFPLNPILPAKDGARAAAFYRDVLGLDQVSPPGMDPMAFSAGNGRLWPGGSGSAGSERASAHDTRRLKSEPAMARPGKKHGTRPSPRAAGRANECSRGVPHSLDDLATAQAPRSLRPSLSCS
jgi:catechol 2,3-dioxygenase-like lactoylglutathione lyase family enzyme